VHFYRNVFTVVPSKHMRTVADMLKAIHACEDRAAARDKANAVIDKLRGMKLKEAAVKIEDAIDETLTFYGFPAPHWRRIRTNNPLERVMREIRRRTRVVGAFPDGNSALMLASARLRHIAGTQWGSKRYLKMELLRDLDLTKTHVA
jgi:transposase-like protein